MIARRLVSWFGALLWLMRPFRAPGMPTVPRGLALLALRYPRLVPPLLRWKFASRGLGLVVARLVQRDFAAADQSTGEVLQAIGEEQGAAVREQLRYGNDPLECARVVALANRVYDIRASPELSVTGEAMLRTPGCPWSREAWWGPGPCGAFSRYEQGLVKGLNPGVRLRYETKRTRGEAGCLGVYSWREGAPAETGGVADPKP